MQNPPSGVSLSFLAYTFSVVLYVDSLVVILRYLKPAFVSEVLDCFAIMRYRPSRCSVLKVCRLAKSQAYKPEGRINQHLLKIYKIIYELFKIVEFFPP